MARRSIGPTAGRGQAAPATPVAPAQTMLTNALLVPLDQLAPDPGQPRRHFDEEGLAELAESIRQDGVLQPLLVYEDGTLEDGRIRYRILDGERRYRASGRVRTDVPVIVVAGRDVTDVRIQQLVANLQREELDPLEEALALRQLMQLADLSLQGVAERIGKPRAYVQRRTDLLFDPRLTEAVRRGEVNASVAIELKRLPDELRQQYLDRVKAGERLEVNQLREEKRLARLVVFGERKTAPRSTGDTEAVRPVASEASLYRIATDGTANETLFGGQQTETTEASLYRIATDDTTSEAHVNGQQAGAPATIGSPSARGERVERSDDIRSADGGDGMRWAVRLAEVLLQAGDAAAHGGLSEAIRAWRHAGRPTGWGEALLQSLDERVR